MSQPQSPPSNPVPGAIYVEDITGLSWVWTGVAWIQAGPSGSYSTQVKTGMALTPGFYAGLSGSGGGNLYQVASQYGATPPTSPSFGQIWVDTTDPVHPITNIWTSPGEWTKISDGVTNTYVDTTTPTAAEIGDSWFNTGNNELNVWDGTSWRPVSAGSGGGTAVAIQSYATNPAVLTEGSVIFNTTDDKIYVSDGSTWKAISEDPDYNTHSITALAAPTLKSGGSLEAGDHWVDTNTHTLNYYDGSGWHRISSDTVGDTHTFYQTTDPGSARPDGESVKQGDLWVNTSDFTISVWTGTVWMGLKSTYDNNTNSIVDATVGGPTQRPTTGDTTLQLGDLWVNTNDFSLSYWTGLTWIPITAASNNNTHSFTGTGFPTITVRPTGGGLIQKGDQYIDDATGMLYWHDGTNWVEVVSVSDIDTHSITGTGDPNGVVTGVRPGTTTPLAVGDMYIDDASSSVYWYDGANWLIAGATDTDTHSFTGTGDPNGVVGPNRPGTTVPLATGDQYVDDATNQIYWYDGANWIATGASVSEATPVLSGTMFGSAVSSATEDTVLLGYRAGVSRAANASAGNTLIGAEVGSTLTTGIFNTILGRNAGYSITTGRQNTFLGTGAGGTDTGSGNTMVGFACGTLSSTSQYNTGVGFSALSQATVYDLNTAIGAFSGSALDGSGNTFIGTYTGSGGAAINDHVALARTTNNTSNCVLLINDNNAFGIPTSNGSTTVDYGMAGQALVSSGSGAPPVWSSISAAQASPGSLGTVYAQTLQPGSFSGGTSVGFNTGVNWNLGSNRNAGLGTNVAPQLQSGDDNVFVGHQVGVTLQSASENVFVGGYSGTNQQNGSNWNVAVGFNTISGNTQNRSSVGNVAIGHQALLFGPGNYNVAVGFGAGNTLLAADTGNVILGTNDGIAGSSNQLILAKGGSVTNAVFRINENNAFGIPTWVSTDPTGNWEDINFGNAGEFLQSQGSGAPPVWSAVSTAADYQTSATIFPATRSDTVSALVTGDLFKSSTTGRSYYYDGTTFVPFSTFNFVDDATPPANETFDNDTWFAPTSGNKYVRYNDGVNPAAWVAA